MKLILILFEESAQYFRDKIIGKRIDFPSDFNYHALNVMVLSDWSIFFTPFTPASNDMMELPEIQQQTAGRQVGIQSPAKTRTSFLATR